MDYYKNNQKRRARAELITYIQEGAKFVCIAIIVGMIGIALSAI